MKIYRCISPKVSASYLFEDSKHTVYSYEGFVLYALEHFDEGLKAFDSDAFLHWLVDDLNLNEVANHLQKIMDSIDDREEQFLSFLASSHVVDDEKLNHFHKLYQKWQRVPLPIQLRKQADEAFSDGCYHKALLLYKRALEIQYDVALLYNIGVTYMKLQFFDAAESIFEQLITLDVDIKYHIPYLKLLMLSGRNHEALEHFHRLTRLFDEYKLYEIKGDLYQMDEDYDHAFEAYNMAFAQGDTKVIYKMLEMASYVLSFEEAMNLIDEYENELGFGSYSLLKYKLFLKNDRIFDGIDVLEAAIKAREAGKEHFVLLSKAYRECRQIIKAIGTIHKGLKIYEQEEEFLYEMAMIAKQAGNHKDYLDKIDELNRLWKSQVRNMLRET